VKVIDINTRECPACNLRFTFGAFQMPTTGMPGRHEFLAEQDEARSRWGFPNKTAAEHGVFGRFGRR